MSLAWISGDFDCLQTRSGQVRAYRLLFVAMWAREADERVTTGPSGTPCKAYG